MPTSRIAVLAAAFVIGLIVWLGIAWLGVSSTASPLDSGKWLLGALLVAGFLVTALERELTWHALLASYLGQASGMCVQLFFGAEHQGATSLRDLPLQMLFLLSFSPANVLGGVMAVALLVVSGREARP
jgi:hypothetical protein